MGNRITGILNISIPVIQAGMVWCSGWKLAHAVSKHGALGMLGAGSMSPDLLEEHIKRMHASGTRNFGVNIPLLYKHAEAHIEKVLKHEVPIVFTSAGNPGKWTGYLKGRGITVVHVVSSLKFALKAQQAGADAVVAEGFEAGGHNGREETTTLVLLQLLREQLDIPVIAAGGIGTGAAAAAAFCLGAEGVQVGTRFAACRESSAHPRFKDTLCRLNEGDTVLTLKELTPVRMVKNAFYNQVAEAYRQCASVDDLRLLLGKGRSRKGIFEGDMENGELEIGQVAALIDSISDAGEVIREIWTGCRDQLQAALKMTEVV